MAEGVETESQLNFLRANDCDEMQGYYFARPLPVEECTRALIDKWRLQFVPAAVPSQSSSALLVDENKDALALRGRAPAMVKKKRRLRRARRSPA